MSDESSDSQLTKEAVADPMTDSYGSLVPSYDFCDQTDKVDLNEQDLSSSDDSEAEEQALRSLKTYPESRCFSYPQQVIACSIGLVNFFEFYGATLSALSIDLPSFPGVLILCGTLSAKEISESNSKLLDLCGTSLCALIECRREVYCKENWLSKLSACVEESSSPSNHDMEEFSASTQLYKLVRNQTLCSGDIDSSYRSNPSFRVDLFSALLDNAAESDLLRHTHDMWMAKSEEMQARKSELEGLMREIDEQDEEFAIQAG